MSYSEIKDWLQENWPNPPDHVLARLRHTLDVYDSPFNGEAPADDEFVALATGGMYQDMNGKVIPTGLTWGDLRKIRTYLEHQWEEAGEKHLAPILNIPLDNFGPEPRPEIR